MQANKYEYQSELARKWFYGGKAEGMAEGKAEGMAEGRAEGRAAGMAAMLLRLLRRKGFAVDAAVEAHVAACKDDEQLSTWADLVLTATSLDEVFAVRER